MHYAQSSPLNVKSLQGILFSIWIEIDANFISIWYRASDIFICHIATRLNNQPTMSENELLSTTSFFTKSLYSDFMAAVFRMACSLNSYSFDI